MNIKNISVIYRLLIIISVLWLIVSMINTAPWEIDTLDSFLSTGILPIILVWSIVWLIQGIFNYQLRQNKSLDIIKGLDRIILVLAIISVIPAYFIGIGTGSIFNKVKYIIPEYQTWKSELENQRIIFEKNYETAKAENREKEFIEANSLYNVSYDESPANPFDIQKKDFCYAYTKEYGKIIRMEPELVKYQYLCGILTSFFCFALLLTGLRLTTRFIKRFSLWIIDGFKIN